MERWLAVLIFVAASAFSQNPNLGVSLGSVGGSVQKRVEVAKQLGATWYRPDPVLLAEADPKCNDCETARAAGLKLVLVVRNASGANKSSAPVTDNPGFQQKLRRLIESYKPEIVVIEYEPEDQKRWFAGTAEEYGIEVQSACEIAHSLGVKCAGGGVSSESMGGLVIDELWKRDQLESASFGIATELVRARSSESSITFIGRRIGVDKSTQETIEKATKAYIDKHREEIDKTRAFVMAAATSDVDYANFHWYEPKPEEVSTVLDVLGRLSKHPPMTDEIGQRQERPFETQEKIKVLLEAGVQPVIWSGVDGKDTVGLVDKSGNLRPNGRAFQTAAKRTASQ